MGLATSKKSTIEEEETIMKKKYQKRIHQFAEQQLEFRLDQSIGKYLNYIPDEVMDIVTKEVKNHPLPDESSLGSKDQLGSHLQHLGREIAEKLIGSVIAQSIPLIESEMKKREENLAKERLHADKSKKSLKKLKRDIDNGYTGKRQYWRGAEVIITPTPLPEHQSAFPNDILVVTNTEHLAHSVSWLIFRIQRIMSPFIDFRNKYQFYGQLANGANSVLLSTDQEIDDKKVLLAVLSEAKRMRDEWQSGLYDYFDSEEKLIDEEQAWISSEKAK